MNNSLKYSKLSTSESLDQLNSNSSNGLTHKEAKLRLHTIGKNLLEDKKETSKLEILIRQLKSIIVLLLVLAGGVSFSMGHLVEGFSVLAVLIVNTTIGFITELKAIRSMEGLKKMGVTSTTVLRDGNPNVIDATEVVPGDIIILEAGDVITADLRIIEASKLSVDESILTGESVPADKSAENISEDRVLAERENILFRGTSLTRGSGKGLVFSTGMNTEVGKIVKVTQATDDEITPLEKKLDKLGHQLIWVSIIIAALVAISGIYSGKEIRLMIETAIALAIATIPEGLPIVATLALAKGMWRMAEKNALINKLSAVETLGATSIILTDKTGTLTENKMTVRSYQTVNNYYEITSDPNQKIDIELRKCIEIGILCNNSSQSDDAQNNFIGDPMEIALVSVSKKVGIDTEKLKKENIEIKQVAFDNESLMMATYHKLNDSYWVAVKGAPEVVIENCKYTIENGKRINLTEKEKANWIEFNKKMAGDGLRILGLASKSISNIEDSPYDQLTLHGLVGLIDPARKDIKESIENCSQAGITTIMVTGDQEGTAIKIARDIGLVQGLDINVIHGKNLPPREQWEEVLKHKILTTKIFCRVSPEQKHSLVSYFQEQNQVIAMTGDGVNDAMALKKADIGVAMGIRGTQVAKESSDMILQDDLFISIISAIKQGRIIYSNIQRFVIYLLSCNISEILIISIAAMINAPLPLMPMQILFLNLVTDVFPALALGMGEGDESYLKIPPRKRNENILTKSKWTLISIYGLIITSCVLTAFFYTLHTTNNEKFALTISFLCLGLAQVFHVFNMRLSHTSVFINDVTKNIHVWGAVALCIVLLVASVKIPMAREVLNLVDLNSSQWIFVTIFSLAPLVIISMLSRFKLGIKS